jgi:hypothetical protein
MRKILTILIVSLGVSFSAASQIDSTFISFPVNDNIVKAFALTDETIKFLPKFSNSDAKELNEDGELWYYIYVIAATPEIDFVSDSGLKQITVHGPFGKEFMNAKDSVELALKTPYFSNIDSTGAPVPKFTIPSMEPEGLYLISIMPFYKNSDLAIKPKDELLGVTKPDEVRRRPGPCIDCAEDELPAKGNYVFNAWISIDDPVGRISFTGAGAQVEILTTSDNTTSSVQVIGSLIGNVIDGWQLMEGVFQIPALCTDFAIQLRSVGHIPIYYDDVRFFPIDGSMKSYVYDPVTFRYVAELDERHFATFYEYDEEGKLKRVKKETERGVMTIQESTNSTMKR